MGEGGGIIRLSGVSSYGFISFIGQYSILLSPGRCIVFERNKTF